MSEIDPTVSVRDDDVDLASVTDGVPSLVRAMRCDRPLSRPLRIPLDEVREIILARGDDAVERDGDRVTVRVADDRMSTVHAKLTRQYRAFVLADEDSKNGTLVNGRRCETAELADGDVIETGHTFFVYRARAPRGLSSEPTTCAADSTEPGELPLASFLPSLARQYERLSRVAPSKVPVIVLGETGTGKEVVARALHRMSTRPGPFLALNCGAIPATLIESELFGVRKGAFSGATDDRAGLVRSADGGTLFLDEIGELPPPAQVALLRVLQEQEVMPIGGTRPIKVDVRIVAATHVPLDRMVDSANFRSDLFARLGGLTVRLPPLRERREDLGLIVASLLERNTGEARRVKLSRQAARALFRYPFRHNIRELEKALGLAITIARPAADGTLEITLDGFPEELRAIELRSATPAPERDGDDEARKAHLIALLTQHRGRIADVARAMGKARMQIHRWLQRYDIDIDSFRKRDE